MTRDEFPGLRVYIGNNNSDCAEQGFSFMKGISVLFTLLACIIAENRLSAVLYNKYERYIRGLINDSPDGESKYDQNRDANKREKKLKSARQSQTKTNNMDTEEEEIINIGVRNKAVEYRYSGEGNMLSLIK